MIQRSRSYPKSNVPVPHCAPTISINVLLVGFTRPAMSSSTQDLSPHINLGNTFGALLIGVALSAVLFGVTNVQTFIYFQTHKGMTFFKLIVIWLWILDALHLALIVHCVYYYLVTNYANFNALTEIVWSLKLQLIVDVLIVPTVHLSYVYRIWIVSKGRSRVLPAIIMCIVVVLSGGVAVPVVLVQYRCRVFQDVVTTEWATYLTLGAVTFDDILIASSLCYLLATSRTGFSSTDSFVTKLLGYIISTGCLTSICSIIAVIACAAMPRNFIFLSIEFLVTKLYVNSFIALLNARYYLQAGADSVGSPKFRAGHDVFHPELRIETSQDEKLQISRTDVSDDAVLHTTRPIQAVKLPATRTMQMQSFSLA
ncbi:uncharacterized protein HD556DRAFT_142543 [Suillus plorans]|uniref:DUF6534 domain-containing protein n=1 Tax=Suillus plorans TaxID=116603 RepID=A0A9P7AAC2_9AGAM|nr:uncharacterized protein HD556DRAFT_142543 [Suillus plorans]KAG1785333.1 hypothetical protein HD556DRAFT_142543 [Suillus plorans]